MSARLLAHRHAGALFAGSAALLVIAMAALSAAILRSENIHLARASGEAHEKMLRSAAESMDRWVGPLLAREGGRHHSDYSAYRSPRRAFTADLEPLVPGQVVEPSPLLGHESLAILLHLQWSPKAGASSPQVPVGPERELALASGLPPESLRVAAERLESLASRLDFPELARWVRAGTPAMPAGGIRGMDQTSCLSPDEVLLGPVAPSLAENAGGASVGPLVPRWSDEDLILVRDVLAGSASLVQVVVVDWPVLSALLLEEGAPDLAGARLGRTEGQGVALATLPVELVAEAPASAMPWWTPWMTRLALAWLAGLSCLGAMGWSLRTSLLFAERRARFAAAMSHELRTPLTTLRLYTELLADGIVSDPAMRQEYLETIQAESARLASLVDNVLLHARIENSNRRALVRMRVGELIESVMPVLRRRADEAGRPLLLEVDLDPAAEVDVDREAVERVLFNLVDNACKHGSGSGDVTLRIEVRRRANFVDLLVRDDGPGIPHALGAAVFDAFRRGEEKGAPGAGLGLALSRSLARELRGELSLLPSARGACFRFSLRLA